MKRKRSISRCLIAVLTTITCLTSVQTNLVKADGVITANANDVVKDMGLGWNLGNTLDSFSATQNAWEISQQKRGNYQMMATYSTKSYSGWDASPVPTFSSTTSDATINWTMSTLNSSKTGSCGNFGLQLINNALVNSGTDTVDFTVTNAQFKKADGTIVPLTSMMNTYSKAILNKVTTYVTCDLTTNTALKTTADLIGGTLTISVKINKYPMPLTPSISKEAYYETLGGNPITTQAMIDKVKSAGFKTVRIPVTYYNHMDVNGNIDQAWLARVAQVVNYVENDGMYAIINVHHDTGTNGWLRADSTELAGETAKFQNIWTQVSNYFKNYDSKLMFEGFNEILNDSNQWTWAGQSSYDAANSLNQMFVNTVRATGGNNATRILIANTYAANADSDTVTHYVVPSDTVPNALIAQVHFYSTNQGYTDSVLSSLNTNIAAKGTPVIIGEFGTTFSTAQATRISTAQYLIAKAKSYGMGCIVWDDGNYKAVAGAQANYGLLDRVAMNWYDPTYIQALVNASNNP